MSSTERTECLLCNDQQVEKWRKTLKNKLGQIKRFEPLPKKGSLSKSDLKDYILNTDSIKVYHHVVTELLKLDETLKGDYLTVALLVMERNKNDTENQPEHRDLPNQPHFWTIGLGPINTTNFESTKKVTHVDVMAWNGNAVHAGRKILSLRNRNRFAQAFRVFLTVRPSNVRDINEDLYHPLAKWNIGKDGIDLAGVRENADGERSRKRSKFEEFPPLGSNPYFVFF